MLGWRWDVLGLVLLVGLHARDGHFGVMITAGSFVARIVQAHLAHSSRYGERCAVVLLWFIAKLMRIAIAVAIAIAIAIIIVIALGSLRNFGGLGNLVG